MFSAGEKQQTSPKGQTVPAHATGTVSYPLLLLDALVLLETPQPDVLEPGTQVSCSFVHDTPACAAVVAPSAYQVSAPKTPVQVPIALPDGQLVPFVPFSNAHIIIWVATSLGERPS
jgi:hypothetical protein